MSTLPVQLEASSVLTVAESIGLLNSIKDESVADRLAEDADFRLRTLVQEAVKVMRHGRRTHLSCEDVGVAISLLGCEPLYGYSMFKERNIAERKKKDKEDAAAVAMSERATAAAVAAAPSGSSSGMMPPPPRPVAGSTTAGATIGSEGKSLIDGRLFNSVKGQNGVFYINDPEIDLRTLPDLASLPKIPLAPKMRSHWLAIEGVQPATVDNAGGNTIAGLRKRLRDGSPINANDTGNLSGLNDGVPTTSTVDANAHLSGFLNAIQYKENVKVPVKHVVSKELQTYFQTVITTFEHPGSRASEIAMESIRTDAGIHPLLPYFTQHVADTVFNQLKNVKMLRCMLQLVHAIITNEHLYAEPYLHQIMPAIITCVVAKNIGDTPSKSIGTQPETSTGMKMEGEEQYANGAEHVKIGQDIDHWLIRREAAHLTGKICSIFGKAYETLEERVARTFFRAFLDPHKPMTTHYGAIMGLLNLGANVVERLVLPNACVYVEFLKMKESEILEEMDKCRKENNGTDTNTTMFNSLHENLYEIRMCKTALMIAVGEGARESIRNVQPIRAMLYPKPVVESAQPSTTSGKQKSTPRPDPKKEEPSTAPALPSHSSDAEKALLDAAKKEYIKECRALDGHLHTLVDHFGDELLPYLGVTLPYL